LNFIAELLILFHDFFLFALFCVLADFCFGQFDLLDTLGWSVDVGWMFMLIRIVEWN
jgi:hypothetical protein